MPDNYEMGNPLNRWFFNSVIMTTEEIAQREKEFDEKFSYRMTLLTNFLLTVVQLSNGRISVVEAEAK